MALTSSYVAGAAAAELGCASDDAKLARAVAAAMQLAFDDLEVDALPDEDDDTAGGPAIAAGVVALTVRVFHDVGAPAGIAQTGAGLVTLANDHLFHVRHYWAAWSNRLGIA